ncbi:29218_t:CDS:2, partial [Racocetra persica]
KKIGPSDYRVIVKALDNYLDEVTASGNSSIKNILDKTGSIEIQRDEFPSNIISYQIQDWEVSSPQDIIRHKEGTWMNIFLDSLE